MRETTQLNGRTAIGNEEVFFVSRESFCIGESSTGYTLYSSVDYDWTPGADNTNAHWSACSDPIAANTQNSVAGVPVRGLSFKLVGNVGTVYIR